RVGPDSLGRGFSLTDRVPVSSSPDHLQHQAEIYLNLARALRLNIGEPHMHFIPTEAERRSVVKADRPQAAVFVGGGSYPCMDLTAKRWPLPRYKELVRRLANERKMQVLLIGGPGDAELTSEILRDLAVPEGSVLDLAGKTSFGESAAQLEACALFI